jgi:hypothetical protein
VVRESYLLTLAAISPTIPLGIWKFLMIIFLITMHKNTMLLRKKLWLIVRNEHFPLNILEIERKKLTGLSKKFLYC